MPLAREEKGRRRIRLTLDAYLDGLDVGERVCRLDRMRDALILEILDHRFDVGTRLEGGGPIGR